MDFLHWKIRILKVQTKLITISQLKKGDVILSTTSDFVSKVVKVGTNSKFSHARLYIGNSDVIEAIEPEVIQNDLSNVMKHDLYTAVYRVDNLTQTQKNNIVLYADMQRGKEYDLSGAIGSVGISPVLTLQNLMFSEADFYCSELIAFSYKKAGVKLEVFSSQTTPKDLAHNNKLKYVGHLKLPNMKQP